MSRPARILTCEQTVAVLSDFLDGALPRAQRYFIKLHLLVCPSCRAFLRSLDQARRMARAVTKEEVPPEVSAMVRELLGRFKAGS